MEIKYNNTDKMLFEYIDHKFQCYIQENLLDGREKELTELRYEEEKEVLKEHIRRFPECLKGLWLAIYLEYSLEKQDYIFRVCVTQCPFIMYLLNLASYDVLQVEGKEEAYLYEESPMWIFSGVTKKGWHDLIKQDIQCFFENSGYQYLWIGEEKNREACGLVAFPDDVELLEHMRFYDLAYLTSGELCVKEECFSETLRQVDYISFLVEDMRPIEIYEELLMKHYKPRTDSEVLEIFALARCVPWLLGTNVCADLEVLCNEGILYVEDLKKHLVEMGLPEKEIHKWLHREGDIEDLARVKELKKIFNKKFLDVLNRVYVLPSKWSVLETFYQWKYSL